MAAISSILVPSSFLEETDDPRVRVHKVGQIGRAAAVFRVPEIVVYDVGPPRPTESQPTVASREGRWIARVLEYQSTAPYLRKRLFPLSPDLTHVGVLPSLNLPTDHVGTEPEEGQVRMGVATGRDVDIGLRVPAKCRVHLPPSDRAEAFEVVRLARGGHVEVRPYDGPTYTGYRVRRAPHLKDGVSGFRNLVGVAMDGAPAGKASVPQGAALAFGTHAVPVRELMAGAGSKIDYVAPVPPGTVRGLRVEESVWATLAALAAH